MFALFRRKPDFYRALSLAVDEARSASTTEQTSFLVERRRNNPDTYPRSQGDEIHRMDIFDNFRIALFRYIKKVTQNDNLIRDFGRDTAKIKNLNEHTRLICNVYLEEVGRENESIQRGEI